MNVKAPHALELTPAEMHAMVESAMGHILQEMESLPEQAADRSGEVTPALLAELNEPLPQQGVPFEQLFDLLFHQAAPLSLNAISPGFMGYVPGGGLFHAAVADLIGDALNRYIGVTHVAPALSQIEASVIRWFCEIVGYPASARGFLTSGGSLANLSALITARETRLGSRFHKGVIYLSDQGHHCIEKAARLAGFSGDALRILPTGDDFCLDPQVLLEAVMADRQRGLEPFLVAASAGTTNTGAIDPLRELAELAREEQLWFHVDAAYGGFFCLTERGRQLMRGIDQADSIVLDPHKTLFLPYGTGALLVRDAAALKRTHSIEADYMPPMQENEAAVDFCELSPELTRPFRGLRVWLPLKMHGAEVFRVYLEEKLDLARWLQTELAKFPQLELLAPANLSILAFALKQKGCSLEARNRATRELLTDINRQQRVHLTGTLLNGVFAIRIAVVAFRTHQERLQMLLEDLQSALSS